MTTVLIPTYNRAHYIRAAVESCLKQTVEVNIIIGDDGSVDDTEKQVRDYPRTTYHKFRHRGEGATRNALLDLCTSEYACWLDSDDLMTPDRVEKQLLACKANSADVCWCGMEWFGTQVKRIPPPDLKRWRVLGTVGMNNNSTNATAFFRTDKVCAIKFVEGLRRGPDSLWCFELFKRFKCCTVTEPLYLYRRHPGMVSLDKSRTPLEQLLFTRKTKELNALAFNY